MRSCKTGGRQRAAASFGRKTSEARLRRPKQSMTKRQEHRRRWCVRLTCFLIALSAAGCSTMATTYVPTSDGSVRLVMKNSQLLYAKNGATAPLSEHALLQFSSSLDSGAPLFACGQDSLTTHKASQAKFQSAQEHYWLALGSLLVGIVVSPTIMIMAPISIYFSGTTTQETHEGTAQGIDAMNMHNDSATCGAASANSKPLPAHSGRSAQSSDQMDATGGVQ